MIHIHNLLTGLASWWLRRQLAPFPGEVDSIPWLDVGDKRAIVIPPMTIGPAGLKLDIRPRPALNGPIEAYATWGVRGGVHYLLGYQTYVIPGRKEGE